MKDGAVEVVLVFVVRLGWERFEGYVQNIPEADQAQGADPGDERS